MLTTPEVIAIILLAYCWTGMEMIILHSQDSFDPPAYIYQPIHKKFLYALIWPIVSFYNIQLGWFFITFLSSCIIYGATYLGLKEFIDWPFLTIAIVRMTPLGIIFSIPLAFVAAALWLVTGAPLGWKMARNQ